MSEVIRKLLKYRPSLSKLIIYQVDIKNIIPLSDEINTAKRINTIDELIPIITERGEKWHNTYQKWLSMGNICIMGMLNGEPAGIMWVFICEEIKLEFGYKIKINSREAFLNDGYIIKSKRKKGVFKFIHFYILNNAKNFNIETLYSSILADNYKSIQANYRLGVKDVKAILYNFSFFKHHFFYLRSFKTFRHISYFFPALKNL